MAADLDSLASVFEDVLPSSLKRVALAVSGGSDSIALLRLAAHFQKHNDQAPEFIVLSVDHKLRPDSALDAVFVAKLSESLGLEAHILSWEGEKPLSGIQEAARHARYTLMCEKCMLLGAEALVTAHTMDDQAETFLMRLKRGSGLDGLSSMSLYGAFDGFLILRPFLTLRRDALRVCLKELGQDWIEDPSNEDFHFERVRVRADMPKLSDMGFSPEHLAQSASRLLRVRQAIETQTQTAIEQQVTWYDAGCCEISNTGFSAQSEEIALRVLSHILFGVGGGEREPQLKKIEHAFGAWQALQPGEGFTLAGCRVIAKRDTTYIVRELARADAPATSRVQAMRPGDKTFWDRRFLCEVSSFENDSAECPKSTDLLVKALGEEGWYLAKERQTLAGEMPSYIGQSLVSLWCGEQLLSVPHIGFIDEKIRFDVEFMPRGVASKPDLQTYLG